MSKRKPQIPIAKRSKASMPMSKCFYIYCNGHTEKIFFEDMKKEFKLGGIVKVFAYDHNRLSLVKKVQQEVKCCNVPVDDISKIYVVYDADIQSSGQGLNVSKLKEQVNAAYDMCLKNKFNPIVSNESFELWILLHYQIVSSPWHREELQKRVEDCLGGYHKTKSPVYKLIANFRDKAISNAKQMAKIHGYTPGSASFTPANACPFTNVYELVEEMLQL